MIDHRIFVTLYALYVLAWLSLLPMISFGMGPGKPNHQKWGQRIDIAMSVVGGLAAVTMTVHFLLGVWT